MRLRLIEGTGELVPDGCQECARLQAKVNGLEQDLLAVERELRSKRATIKAMRTDRDKARQAYVRREEVERLMQLWREFFNHPKAELGDDRFDPLKKMLERYGFEACEWVLWGARAEPYRNKQGKVVDRISFLFGSSEVFERFANVGYKAKKAVAP